MDPRISGIHTPHNIGPQLVLRTGKFCLSKQTDNGCPKLTKSQKQAKRNSRKMERQNRKGGRR